jgi:hypothetical protein
MSRVFLIRKPDGTPHPVIGVDVDLPFLSDYRFFAWEDEFGCWRVTEARTGGLVLKGDPGQPLEYVSLAANTKLEMMGRAKCVGPINKILAEYEPLNNERTQ